MVTVGTLIGVWVAAFLMLCIFSFLYNDNPFYKFAEHVFVGVSAGYWMAVLFNSSLVPNLFEPLADAWTAMHKGHWSWDWFYLMPVLLGVMLILQLVPRVGWISRWPLAFMVGLNAGYQIVYTMDARILKQVDATINPLWGENYFVWPNFLVYLQSTLIVVGVLTVLVYFWFSVEHKGLLGGVSRVGIYTLMITFGASFGYTVMARISLLIGQMMFFKNEVWVNTYRFFTQGGG